MYHSKQGLDEMILVAGSKARICHCGLQYHSGLAKATVGFMVVSFCGGIRDGAGAGLDHITCSRSATAVRGGGGVSVIIGCGGGGAESW